MINFIRCWIKKREIAKEYELHRRNGFEIVKKRREIHEAYLVANRQKQREVEEFHRGQLNIIDWMVKNDKS